jgi:hypothetical protein
MDLKKNSPGFITGTVLGTLCLLGAVAMRIFQPDFTGFFDRGHSESAMQVWMLLLGIAVVNYAYAGLSFWIQRRTQ